MSLDVSSILGDEGHIARRLPTYESRPQQLEMAQSVERAIRTQSHLIVEAGTGVGKSFAYLVPAILCLPKRNQKLPRNRRRLAEMTMTMMMGDRTRSRSVPPRKKTSGVESLSRRTRSRCKSRSLRATSRS